MARESFSHSTVVNAPRARIWGALDDPETWNAVAGVERVHEPIVDAKGRLQGFKFDTIVAGKAYEGIASPHARSEGEALSWDIANSQITGVIKVELEDVTGGTLLEVGVEMEARGMLSRMFFGTISKVVGNGLPNTVNDMARMFEAK